MKKIILFFLCLIFCVKAYGTELKFAQVTDVHFSADGVQQQNSRDTSHTKKVLTWAVRSLNNKSPKFVVFMGDNIDKSNEEDLKDIIEDYNKVEIDPYTKKLNHYKKE